MKYEVITEVTPNNLICMCGACPSIYEGLKELTPQEEMCGISACPATYEARNKEGREVYLIIGTQINPLDAGLENKVSEGEVLVEIPRTLIDNKGK